MKEDDLDLTRDEVRELLDTGEPVEIIPAPWGWVGSSTGWRIRLLSS